MVLYVSLQFGSCALHLAVMEGSMEAVSAQLRASGTAIDSLDFVSTPPALPPLPVPHPSRISMDVREGRGRPWF